MINYSDLICKIEEMIKKKTLGLQDEIFIYRNDRSEIVQFCLKKDKEAEKVIVKAMLQEMMKNNNILGLIPAKEWAFLNNLENSTVRKKAISGELKTAKKLAGAWYIDPYEEID